jgi:hypothetical protein
MRKLLGGLAVFTTPVAAMAMFTSSQPGNLLNDPTLGRAAAKGLVAAEEKAQLEDLAKLCGLECGSFADGEASVTGIGSVDSFFSAVLALEGKVGAIDAELRANLGELAAIVGAEVDVNGDLGVAADGVATAYGNLIAEVEGGVTLDIEPARCSVSVDATLQAKAKCEAEATPPKVAVECKGECVAEANVMASCEGELKCTGTAPSFDCEGTCSGACDLKAGGTCEGSCEGTCNLEVAGKCDGECSVALDEDGNCEGECKLRAGAKCEGSCEGRCNLEVAAKCEGECRGECTWTPGTAECTGRASCQASGNAAVQCEGECRGDVEPPMVKAECEASVKAEAQMSAECTPPRVRLDYELDASFGGEGAAGLEAKTAFDAKLRAFASGYARLAATSAKFEGIAKASQGLTAAAGGAIEGAAKGVVGGGDFAVKFKVAACLPDAVVDAKAKLTASAGKLSAGASAIAKVTTSVAGS